MLLEKETSELAEEDKTPICVDHSMIDSFMDIIDKNLFDSIIIDTEKQTVTIKENNINFFVYPTRNIGHNRIGITVKYNDKEIYSNESLTPSRTKEKLYAYTENMLKLHK